MYGKVHLLTGTVHETTPSFPRKAWSAEIWKDPENNLPKIPVLDENGMDTGEQKSPCPEEYKGFGWFPVVQVALPALLMFEQVNLNNPTFAYNQTDATVERTDSVIEMEVVEARSQVIELVKQEAAQLVADGFSFDGAIWDFETSDQMNLNSMVALAANGHGNPHGNYWRDRDNNKVTMNLMEFKAFTEAIGQYGGDIQRAVHTHKDTLAAVTTLADLRLYDLDQFWPTLGRPGV